MTCLKIPKFYSIPKGQKANWIAKRIGIKFNGEIRPLDVVGYNVSEGWIDTVKGERLLGTVEPFWR